MSDSDLKVTDRRMFTPEGELREEYRHLGDAEAKPRPEATRDEPEGEESRRRPEPEAPPVEPDLERGVAGRVEIPSTPGPGGAKPTFYDLLATLIEPASVYLGDVELPDGSKAEDLELARLYIDLLEVLLEKTRGNLDARELGVLEDSLYRLRMRHVQRRDG